MQQNPEFLKSFLDHEIYIIEDSKDLYTNPDEKEVLSKVEEQSIEYEGSNSKGVLVVIDAEVSEDEEELLAKILSSIGLTRDEIALVRNNPEFNEYIDQLASLKFEKIISFGVASGKTRLLDIQTKYAPTTVEGRSVIMCDTLHDLNENTDMKRQLWNCLKEVFN